MIGTYLKYLLVFNKQTSFVIVCDILNIDHSSPRLVKAQQHGIPIISSEYISCCARLEQKIPYDDFTVIIKTVRVEEHAVVPTSKFVCLYVIFWLFHGKTH